MRVLHEDRDGDGGTMVVYETSHFDGEFGRYRVLAFADGAAQGVKDMDHPDRIVFEYPRAILHLMETHLPDFEDVYVIGLGIGTIPSRLGDRKVKVAEIDPRVEEVSRQYFGYALPNVMIGDGRELLEEESDGAYDFIVLDAFTEEHTPLHLLSKEFFLLCRSKLNEQGGLMMNLFGRGRNDPLIGAVHTTLQSVFPHTACYELPQERAADRRNMILIGSGRKMAVSVRNKQMAGFTSFTPEERYIIQD